MHHMEQCNNERRSIALDRSRPPYVIVSGLNFPSGLGEGPHCQLHTLAHSSAFLSHYAVPPQQPAPRGFNKT